MVWLVFKERILLPLQLATHSKQRKADVKLGTHFTTYGGVMKQSPAVAAWLRENGLLK